MLNKSSSTANPGKRTPHELFYGVVPKLRMLPFLRPGYCRVRRNNKAEPKAEQCFYLSRGTRRPAYSLKVIMSSGAITYTRDLTWEHPRAPFPSAPAEISRHMSAPEEGGGVVMEIRPPPPYQQPPSLYPQPPLVQ